MSLSLLLPLFLACASYPEGLRATPDGDGPTVRVDWDHKPLPDVPYPTDLATRLDRHSPTGLRLNVPTDAVTKLERESREKLNTLSGFGIYSPITVAFDAPLDLDNIVAHHRRDPRRGADQFVDDLFLVIDVTPDSPDYLQPVPLDVGQGHFPMDAARGDRYFPNDTRADQPSLVFDTVDEDLNENGVLDWGEDTDNDGVLDKPNVYPEGGDPRADLLTFYEKQTDTLIMRPITPLREETTYAVVLTTRLIGTDGNPVRSPFTYINHLRQTQALEPLWDALPSLGLGMSDVAFAWTFTTGRVTGDLVDARRGLLGEGPLAALDLAFPEGVNEALQVDDIEGGDIYRLPVGTLISTLANLGLFPDEAADTLVQNYTSFGDVVVGGSFNTANFMGDVNEDPAPWPQVDDSDDFWQVDGFNGTYKARSERVPFTCVLPKDSPYAAAGQPIPVVSFGHGYGSSRFDFLGFAWAFNRVGMAACAFDYPGHGPTISADQQALIEAVLGSSGLYPFYTHLLDSRYRDLDNDGVPDSGGDQWSADAFHTRDMVRQAAIDHAQFIDSLRACGTGTMTKIDGTTAVSCDWDGDGQADIGGPDARYYGIGGSLGGINIAVAAAVIDEGTAWVPIVPGGGLLDIALRTEISGAVEAMDGRLMSPLILGTPQKDGSLLITQMVNSVTDMVELPMGTVSDWPAGGLIEVENVTTGVVRQGLIPQDGTLRVSIAADAASAWEKRQLASIPDDGPIQGQTYTLPDTTQAGDQLVVRLYTTDGTLVATLDSFPQDVLFQGVIYKAGSPLVAGAEGLGYVRASPDFRRVGFVFSAILEPGDPIAYARALNETPFDELNGQPRNVLMMPTPGDSIVSINTGIALARSMGLIEMEQDDDRYGMTVDEWLIDRKVVQGLEQYGPYTCTKGKYKGSSCLFDADDLDQGLDDWGAPSDEPLRAERQTSAGVSGMRLPYVKGTGTHGFSTPDPSLAFDINTFSIMQAASYFLDNGQQIRDDLCLEDASCDWLGVLPDTGQTDTGGKDTGGKDTGGKDTGGKGSGTSTTTKGGAR